jgi:nitroimidazol reductase NimA-like FMN-containing flavoprotein (pyridoxamine 5'-phosphate oxidase superfamily)
MSGVPRAKPIVDPRTGLEELDVDECLRLAGECVLGRLAVVVDGQPLVFPVNFVLDGSAVVLRTDEGTKLYAARHGAVAFECDDVDRLYHTGWSVIMTGHAEEVRAPDEVARLARLPLGPWCPVAKPVWLRLRPRTITGRRIPLHGIQ